VESRVALSAAVQDNYSMCVQENKTELRNEAGLTQLSIAQNRRQWALDRWTMAEALQVFV